MAVIIIFVHVPHINVPSALEKLKLLLRPGGILFLTFLESDQIREYSIEDFGGSQGDHVWFYCHSKEEIFEWSKMAKFQRTEVLNIPSSLYDELPRLKEKGVRQYQVIFKV